MLCFFGSAGDGHAQAAIAAVRSRPAFFDDETGSFFGVSNDPTDDTAGRVAESYPGYRFIWDFDLAVARLYGVAETAPTPDAQLRLRRQWIILDPTLHVLHAIPFARDRSDIDLVGRILDALPPPVRSMGFEIPAPVLFLHNIFEPGLCRTMIDLYEAGGGIESGFMREEQGRTVMKMDPDHKRRRDVELQDQALIGAIQARFRRRIIPEIARVHYFEVTRMERYIVACYSAEDGGHFRPHRDNTTKGTAHRRFAVSVNLNDDFEGGEISFPEYGRRSYKMPPGGAAIFSCSLLHSVSKVTSGRRYAFLPFLYDESAAAIRAANNVYLSEGVRAYGGMESHDGVS